jgi:hypothetical protein
MPSEGRADYHALRLELFLSSNSPTLGFCSTASESNFKNVTATIKLIITDSSYSRRLHTVLWPQNPVCIGGWSPQK